MKGMLIRNGTNYEDDVRCRGSYIVNMYLIFKDEELLNKVRVFLNSRRAETGYEIEQYENKELYVVVGFADTIADGMRMRKRERLNIKILLEEMI